MWEVRVAAEEVTAVAWPFPTRVSVGKPPDRSVPRFSSPVKQAWKRRWSPDRGEGW